MGLFMEMYVVSQFLLIKINAVTHIFIPKILVRSLIIFSGRISRNMILGSKHTDFFFPKVSSTISLLWRISTCRKVEGMCNKHLYNSPRFNSSKDTDSLRAFNIFSMARITKACILVFDLYADHWYSGRYLST